MVGPRPEKQPLDTRFPQDLTIKKGYTASEQIGIAIAVLVENGQMELVDWTQQASSYLSSTPSCGRGL